MKKNRVASLFAFSLFLLFPLAALADPPQTIVLKTALLAANEVPPIAGLTATGAATLTVTANRDGNGVVTSGTVDFDINYSGFAPGTTFTGLHVHNGSSTAAGPVVIGTNLGAGVNSVLSPTGSGNIFRRVVVDGTNATQLAFLQGLVAQPQRYYANLHTTVNPGGAIRGQLGAATLVFRTLMSPDQEVPPVTGTTAQGVATTTINVNRDSTGAVISGTVDFDVAYQFPTAVTLTGLHIHRGAAGIAGPVVISSGLGSGNNSIPLDPASCSNGVCSGNIYRRADVLSTDATGLSTLNGILADPTGFYVNMHTTANPGGVIRGQFVPDTYVFVRPMSVNHEVPPVAGSTASGRGLITAKVTRDGAGNVASGTVEFNVDYALGGAATFTGMHIHNGGEGIAGPVVINSGLSVGDNVNTTTGTGNITRTATVASDNASAVTALRGLVENPEQYYVNLHTTASPGGLIRSQMENTTLVHRLTLRPENEIPPVTGLAASAAATVVARIAKNDKGNATQGTVDFDVAYTFPAAPVTFVGLHLHDAPLGVNGPVVLSSGIGAGANSISDDDGVGVIFRRGIFGSDTPAALTELDGLGKSPDRFYANLHTTVNPGGVIRSQLTTNTYQFPQAGGGGGVSTSLVIGNPSTTASASGTALFFGADGKPQDSIVSKAIVPFVIPPSGTVTLSTNSLGSSRAGYARVLSPDTLTTGSAVNLPGFATATGSAGATDAYSFRASVVRDAASGVEAGVAVVNVSDQTVRVVFNAYDFNNPRRLSRASVILQPGQQFSSLLGDLFSGIGRLDAGTLRIAALAPLPVKALAVSVLQFGPQVNVVPLTPVTKVEDLAAEELQ